MAYLRPQPPSEKRYGDGGGRVGGGSLSARRRVEAPRRREAAHKQRAQERGKEGGGALRELAEDVVHPVAVKGPEDERGAAPEGRGVSD